jgi:heterodisulfide reductase subunit A-like polyferredoxin
MPEQDRRIGAALVVGGGLAGIQASLTLAGMGYTVHLLDASERIAPSTSSLGDEALCLLSHKAMAVKVHPHIDLMTRAEGIEVTGEAGAMKARIGRMNSRGEREEITLDMGAVVLTLDQAASSTDRRCAEGWHGLLPAKEGTRKLSEPDPALTSRPGVYACGLAGPGQKDLHLLLLEATAAAGRAADDLVKAGLSRNADPPLPEIPDRGTEPPRVGLFLCECAVRMAGISDLHPLLDQASILPFTQHTGSFPLACRPEAQEELGEAIRECRLNRIVLACPQSGARALFLQTCRGEDIDSHLFHQVRIGPDCMTPEGAPSLEKARDLIEKAILKAALQQPRMPSVEGVVKTALVAGGGVVAMVAALSTAKKGYTVHLVEKAERLAGSTPASGQEIQSLVRETIEGLQNDRRVVIHLGAACLETRGYVGNFQTRVRTPNGEITLSHGAAILSDQDAGETPEKEGFFFAGPSEASRSIAEAVIRARASAALASTVLSRDRILVRGVAPSVSRGQCVACLTCVRTCPCGVPYVDEKGFATIEPAICKGCGTCVAECPGKALSLHQFTDEEMRQKLEMASCSLCGQPYLSAGRLEYLKRRLSEEDLRPLDRHLCPTCSRKKFVEDHFEVRESARARARCGFMPVNDSEL